jgi:hypothetical protein
MILVVEAAILVDGHLHHDVGVLLQAWVPYFIEDS